MPIAELQSTVAFSVVLPTYNRAEIVLEAVNSVLASSFADLELIVVDDSSTDGTAALLAGVSDPRLRVVMNEGRKGTSGARNHGIAKARADWICQIDSDDLWDVDMLANLARGVAGAAESVGVVYGSDHSVDLRSGELLSRRSSSISGSAFPQMLVRHFYHHCAAAFRKSALESVGGYDETLNGMEDTDLQHRLSECWEVLPVPEAVYYYRLGSGDQLTKEHRQRSVVMRAFLAKHDSVLRSIPASRVKIVGVVMLECLLARDWRHAASLWLDLMTWSWAAPRRAYRYHREAAAVLQSRSVR